MLTTKATIMSDDNLQIKVTSKQTTKQFPGPAPHSSFGFGRCYHMKHCSSILFSYLTDYIANPQSLQWPADCDVGVLVKSEGWLPGRSDLGVKGQIVCKARRNTDPTQ